MNIIIAAVGGQGALFAARVIGNAALESGFDVKVSEVHGMSQRGGSVVTFVRYGKKLASPIVEEGTADILLAFELLEAGRYAHFVKSSGTLIVNDTRIAPLPVLAGAVAYPQDLVPQLKALNASVEIFDATAEAIAVGNPKGINAVMLGRLARYTDLKKELFEKAIAAISPKKFASANCAAFNKGYEK